MSQSHQPKASHLLDEVHISKQMGEGPYNYEDNVEHAYIGQLE
jgi:hypothetical protein